MFSLRHFSQRARQSLRVAAALAAALAFAAGCNTRDGGLTGAGSDRPVRFALGASIVAAPGAVIEAVVSYTPPGDAPFVIARDSIDVDTGGDNSALTLTANVAACLAAPFGETGCTLTIAIRLKRNGVVLDEATRTVSVTAETSEITITSIELFEVSSVRITPATVTGLEPGDSLQLVAQALDRVGGIVPARAATWSVTGTAVSVSASGMLRALASANATVRATMGERTQDLAVTVGPPTVASLTLEPADTTVFVGGTAAYRVTVRSSTGAVLTGRPVTFSSAQPSIASVNASGVATALGVGNATIRVESTQGRNGATVSATAILRVNPLTIAVAPTSMTFETEIGQPLPIAQTATVTSPSGGPIGALQIVPPLDTLLTASLNATSAPATLTIRPSMVLSPGSSTTRSVSVRTSNPLVAPVAVSVTIIGRTPPAQLGRFSGLVINAANSQPIGQATVTIRNQSNVQVAQTFTAGNGTWLSPSLPAGTYNLTFSNSGFLDVAVLNQQLIGGPSVPTTSLATVAMASVSAGAGAIEGSVRDATTGDALQGATVELRAGANNTQGTPIAVTSTNSDGLYVFPSRPSGTYTVRSTRAGYAEGSVFVVVAGGNVTAPVVFLSPAGAGVAWRFVLSWGSSPQDLDAHLTGPILNSASRFHVFFGDTGSLAMAPFAALDNDEVFGFGPETITMSQQLAGVYRFYVNNFSLETPLRSSSARVDVYQGNTLFRQFFPPQQDGEYWTVFELDGTSLTTIGTIGNLMPSLAAPGPRRRESAADRAAAEWYQLGPHTWRKPPQTKRR